MTGETDKDYREINQGILFADDQKFMLKNLERHLKKYFNVFTAKTFNEAKEKIENNNIAVVISDHQMADGQGVELLEYLTKTHPDIRRIMITADRNEGVVIDYMEKNLVNSIAYKPTVKDQVHTLVNQQMEIFLKNN